MAEATLSTAERAVTEPHIEIERTSTPVLLDITRDEVFAANDTQVEVVPVDEWKKGAVVYVHTMSAEDREYLESELAVEPDGKGGVQRRKISRGSVRAHFVAMCARNSAGERIFTPEDIERLKRKNVAPMDRIYEAMIKALTITERDVDDMAKNSDAASTDI